MTEELKIKQDILKFKSESEILNLKKKKNNFNNISDVMIDFTINIISSLILTYIFYSLYQKFFGKNNIALSLFLFFSCLTSLYMFLKKNIDKYY